MATAAKFPAALLTLADLGAEYPDAAAPTELTLNGNITNVAGTFIVNEAIPASWPAAGWVKIDNETIHYSAYVGGTKTFTADVRGAQTTYGSGAAASHTTGATVGLWLSPQAINQLMADLIATQTRLGTTRTRTIFLSASDCQTYGGGTAGTLGPHSIIIFPDVSATGGAAGSFIVPADFVSLTSVKALVHCAATANMYLSTRLSYAYKSDGTQNYQNRSDSTVAGVVAMTTNLVNAVDISAMADALTPAVGDIIGLQVVRDGTQGTDTMNSDVEFHGFLVTYVALY